MSEPAMSMGIKAASASALIKAYGELKEGGVISEPEVTAAAYAEIQSLLDFLEGHGVADKEYTGLDLLVLIDKAKNAN